MGSRMYHSVAAVTILLFLAGSTEARFKGINEFCRTSDTRLLCTAMVQGAANWHDAVLNAINSALHVADQMDKMIPAVEPTLVELPLISRKSTVESCKDNFDSAVDNLKRALKFLEQNDKGSLNIYLSAVSTTDCVDAFQQFRTPFPAAIGKVAKQLDKQISVCLAVSQQI